MLFYSLLVLSSDFLPGLIFSNISGFHSCRIISGQVQLASLFYLSIIYYTWALSARMYSSRLQDEICFFCDLLFQPCNYRTWKLLKNWPWFSYNVLMFFLIQGYQIVYQNQISSLHHYILSCQVINALLYLASIGLSIRLLVYKSPINA